METFLEFLREVLKGMVRAVSAYLFRIHVLENKKTTLGRRKLKGGYRRKQHILTTNILTVEVAERSRLALLSFIIFLLYIK
ncbi:hypothetical protein SLU01_20940 [Sporosarcina luteola]|uniref:Uncharacterized protein n=1 Tax=Sporosarcina luteola TaxID=582850 RepID=A0A511Z8K2_9BACL|nr:hypothetical protein [Sporosarcina luteola]GEN83782.1 hypothetical protein SLU01_20940 [Sporosarcina luteola]